MKNKKNIAGDLGLFLSRSVSVISACAAVNSACTSVISACFFYYGPYCSYVGHIYRYNKLNHVFIIAINNIQCNKDVFV